MASIDDQLAALHHTGFRGEVEVQISRCDVARVGSPQNSLQYLAIPSIGKKLTQLGGFSPAQNQGEAA
jgi:hypothetical protein